MCSNQPFIETRVRPLCSTRCPGHPLCSRTVTLTVQLAVMPGAALLGAVSVGEAGLIVHGEHLLQSTQVGSGSLVQAQVVPCSHGHNLLEREESCEAGVCWEGLGVRGGQRTQRRVQAVLRMQASGQALGAPGGEEVTSTPNDQAGCSVRPGAIYERVWRCFPTAAPQHSPGDRPCAHG